MRAVKRALAILTPIDSPCTGYGWLKMYSVACSRLLVLSNACLACALVNPMSISWKQHQEYPQSFNDKTLHLLTIKCNACHCTWKNITHTCCTLFSLTSGWGGVAALLVTNVPPWLWLPAEDEELAAAVAFLSSTPCFSLMMLSPCRMWQKIESIVSAILEPWTLNGLRPHR